MSDNKDKKFVAKEAVSECPIHHVRFPAHLGCPRCRSGN